MFANFGVHTYMSSHIFKAVIEPCQHLGKLLAPYKVSCSRCIESPCDWLQKVIVFKIVVEVIGQLSDPFLLVQQTFALLLKDRRLSFDLFERIAQRSKVVKCRGGV